MEREKAQDGCWASLILRDGQRKQIPRRIRQKSGRERTGRATHRNQRGGVTSELGNDQRGKHLTRATGGNGTNAGCSLF